MARGVRVGHNTAYGRERVGHNLMIGDMGRAWLGDHEGGAQSFSREGTIPARGWQSKMLKLVPRLPYLKHSLHLLLRLVLPAQVHDDHQHHHRGNNHTTQSC